MIDWNKTKEIYGYSEGDRIPQAQKVVLKCDFCSTETHNTKHYHYRAIHRQGFFRCLPCSRVGSSERMSKISKARWLDPEYRAKQEARTHTDELKKAARSRALDLWQDKDYVDKFNAGFDPDLARANLVLASEASRDVSSERLKGLWKDASYRARMSAQTVALWSRSDYRESVIDGLKAVYADPEFRYLASLKVSWTDDRKAKLSDSMKLKWQDDDYRRRCAEARSKYPKTSYLEDMVADVLDAYGITYVRQAVVGPWVFDFLLPESNLLVEVNGWYWHSLRESRDRAKSTYIDRHTDYKLQVITESDLAAEGKLVALWARTIPTESVDFHTLRFEQCLKTEIYDLFSAFHYMGKPARGGRYFRLISGTETIAGIIGSPVHRQEVATSIGLSPQRVIEISRLVIHPKYQVKNLGSWVVSRFVRWCGSKYDAVVAFADTGIHRGTVYLAAGFHDYGLSRTSDYEYIDVSGFRLHKKTVWDAAKRNGLIESEYADRSFLTKRMTAPRRKFVLRLNSRLAGL